MLKKACVPVTAKSTWRISTDQELRELYEFRGMVRKRCGDWGM